MESAIIKYLCANNGSVNKDELVANCVFGDATTVSAVIKNQDRFAVGQHNREKRLIAKTGLRLCRTRDCRGCQGLHLCKTYMYGECQFVPGRRQATCSFSHDFDSKQNSALLSAHGLADLDKQELCVLLLQNDAALLPSVCFNYNNTECNESCTRMHICENYLLRGGCSCFRAHDFYEPQPYQVLQKSRIPNSLMVAMKPLYINKRILGSLEYKAKAKAKAKNGPAGVAANAASSGIGASGGIGATGGNTRTGHYANTGANAYISFYAHTGVDANTGSDAYTGADAKTGGNPYTGAEATSGGDAYTSDNASTSADANIGGAAHDHRSRRPMGARGMPQKERTEICLFFLKGGCKHTTEKCLRAHYTLPYSWEVLESQEWTVLANSEGIEKDYCDPKKTYSAADVEMVCFDTMTRGLQKARRLSSVSLVLQPTFLLTTQWLWYWQDEYGVWKQYDSPTISSTDLELKFQNAPQEEVEFTAGSQAYVLNFQDMIQTNKRYGTKRLVRRRPFFVSSVDVQNIKTSKKPLNRLPHFQGLPRHWDQTLVPETGHKNVPLLQSSGEYREVEKLFRETMKDFDILKIERIQNKSLWDHFQLQRDQMKTRNGGRDVAERQLFHGTDSKYIDAICCSNFDWRICGTHGTAYGKGSYFATDASYSHNYTGQSATRAMFVSRVLVGHHTAGSSSYLRPPSKDGGDTIFYDSCVDNMRSPTIFVVFDRPQIYPEYLLTYKERASAWAAWADRAVASAAPVTSPTPAQQAQQVPAYLRNHIIAPSPSPPQPPKNNDSCVVS